MPAEAGPVFSELDVIDRMQSKYRRKDGVMFTPQHLSISWPSAALHYMSPTGASQKPTLRRDY